MATGSVSHTERSAPSTVIPVLGAPLGLERGGVRDDGGDFGLVAPAEFGHLAVPVGPHVVVEGQCVVSAFLEHAAFEQGRGQSFAVAVDVASERVRVGRRRSAVASDGDRKHADGFRGERRCVYGTTYPRRAMCAPPDSRRAGAAGVQTIPARTVATSTIAAFTKVHGRHLFSPVYSGRLTASRRDRSRSRSRTALSL